MTVSSPKYKFVVVDTCTEYEHQTSDSFFMASEGNLHS